MTVQVTGKNLDVGEALRTHVSDKLSHAMEKYFGNDQPDGHVRIVKEAKLFRTDCSIHLHSGLHLQSHGESLDAYASAEQAFDRLEKRLRRYHRRLKRHHTHGANDARTGVPAADRVISSGESVEGEPEEGQDNPLVIAETTLVMREIAVSEAVMDLDLGGKAVVVFRNAAHGRINVVYRREDGNIGWIDPEADGQRG